MANPVKIKARVMEVMRHSQDVVSYRLQPEGRVPVFQPGQFLHLALDPYRPEYPWPESRVFSIASSPSRRRDELCVTVSIKGRYTRRIVAALGEGSECWLKLPYGSFLFPTSGSLALVAGGVGITPFVALLQDRLEQVSAQPLTLYYGIRYAQLYLYRDLLNRCQERLPNFKLIVYCETGECGRSGPLRIADVLSESPEESLFYLSGPPEMITTFKLFLTQHGVADERIIIDDWE